MLNSKYFVPQNRERIFIIGYLRGTSRPKIFPIRENVELSNYKESSNIRTLTGGGHSGGLHSDMTLVVYNEGVFEKKDISHGIDASYAKGSAKHRERTMVYLSNTNANMKKRVQDRDESWTLTNNSNDFGIKDQKKIRRLTPKECERLQGFPDDFTKGISDTQRYKCLGNAVTVPVVEFVLSKIKEVEE